MFCFVYWWTFTDVPTPFIPHLTLSGIQSESSTVYVEILPLCCVLFFMWCSSTFFTKLSVAFLPWHSTYFVRYCIWIVFVQRKTFHTQPINLIFMKDSITELPYQLAEQIRWHKAWCLTCITKLNISMYWQQRLVQPAEVWKWVHLDVWIRMAGKRLHKRMHLSVLVMIIL
jgi:hypothetical protein